MSALAHAWWWVLDYLYAGRRHLAALAPPWPRHGLRAEPRAWARGCATLPEVVLLPGVYEHWTFLRPLGDALNDAGVRIRVVHGLGTNRRSVVETAYRLARALTKTAPPPAGRVIVAHSKGGLIGKQLLIAQAETPLGFRGMVTVCTPFGGSRLANLFRAPSIRAFRPTDETILALGRASSVNARIVSVFGRYDPHIPEGSVLVGATNVEVAAHGHFRVLGSPRTHRAVIEGIESLSAAPG